jgi:kanamycin kinase
VSGPTHQLGDPETPDVVLELARGTAPALVWRNDLGGLTFRVGDRFVKWNPRTTGVDLDRERVRLDWLSSRHPAPRVLAHGADDGAQWLVTAALPGEHAVGDRWRARRDEAIGAIATGLRAIHAVPVTDVGEWATRSWPHARPDGVGDGPPVDRPVLVHGDACAPNTLVDDDGRWTGHVDVGDLCVGDRWADLAVASLSLDWNFGEGHQDTFFAAYGVDRDEQRIRWYRDLWHAAS